MLVGSVSPACCRHAAGCNFGAVASKQQGEQSDGLP